MTNAMVPEIFKIARRTQESEDVVTLQIEPKDKSLICKFEPGQFNMLYAFGLGEAAISLSGNPSESNAFTHTIRAVGNVTKALCALEVGDSLGVRGPFGTKWPLELAFGKTLLLVAGGIGLAPLRPALYFAAQYRNKFKDVILLCGARSPHDLLFMEELEQWRTQNQFTIEVSVDHADIGWNGHVDVVPKLLTHVNFTASDTVAMMCGPEIMMRYTFVDLVHQGVPKSQILISMERNMKCAFAQCGHCQYGPLFICKDGPVFDLTQIESFLQKREL